MSEFDRSQHTVGDRTVLVTSWFDDTQQTWRANAPHYNHLVGITSANQARYEDRRQAINALITVLNQKLRS